MPYSYATALLDLSKQKSAVEPIHQDVETLSTMLRSNEAIKDFMLNPVRRVAPPARAGLSSDVAH